MCVFCVQFWSNKQYESTFYLVEKVNECPFRAVGSFKQLLGTFYLFRILYIDWQLMKSDEASYSKCLKTGRAAAPPAPLVPSALGGAVSSQLHYLLQPCSYKN